MVPPLAWYPPLSQGSIFRNLEVGTNLSDVATSEMSLKPHLECFTNPCYMYIKCFCILISCEWVYGTTLSLIPPLSLGSIFRNLGVRTDLSDVVTSEMSLKPHLECFVWCGYIVVEPQTSLGVLHKSILYIYKVFQHLDKLWIDIWIHP